MVEIVVAKHCSTLVAHLLSPRICSRVFMLIILATVRGVYVSLEQPSSSTMRWFPDFVNTARLITKHLGNNIWRESFLSKTQF